MADADAGTRHRVWDAGTLGVLGLVAASHVLWAFRDARVPWDQGLFYPGLARMWGDPSQAPAVLATPTGWYDAVLALVFAGLGRSPAVLHGVLVVQVLSSRQL